MRKDNMVSNQKHASLGDKDGSFWGVTSTPVDSNNWLQQISGEKKNKKNADGLTRNSEQPMLVSVSVRVSPCCSMENRRIRLPFPLSQDNSQIGALDDN